MSLKSWTFWCRGHPVRAEVWWRFPGWSRQRLYIDHELAAERRGYARTGEPLSGNLGDAAGEIEVRFRRSALGFRMACVVRVEGVVVRWEDQPVRVERGIPDDEPQNEGFLATLRMALIGCLFVLPFLLVLMMLAVPLVMVGLFTMKIQEARFERRRRRRGRFLDWLEVERRMREAPSTLIFQIGMKRGARVWWTEEDVLARSPLPPPRWDRGPAVMRGDTSFGTWCHFHYLSEDRGRAYLTTLPAGRARQVDFLDESEPAAWRAEFPLLRVATASFGFPERLRRAEPFVALLGPDAEQSVPGLIAGLRGDDPTLRSMAVDALRDIGPAAGAAVPALVEHLYDGPQAERYKAALALAAIGPEAVEPLTTASECGDPWIRQPAITALEVMKRAPLQPTGSTS
jgi:hypothetical protein